MARRVNQIEGEIALEHEGQTYRLRFDFNTVADFERETGGRNLMQALSGDGESGPAMIDLRKIFWLCFAEYHLDVTERQAGRIYSADTGVLDRLLAQALPMAVAPAAEGELGNGQAAA